MPHKCTILCANCVVCLLELHWTAPEMLRSDTPRGHGTKKADMYSFAIVFKEVVNRSSPYHEYDNEFTAKGGYYNYE